MPVHVAGRQRYVDRDGALTDTRCDGLLALREAVVPGAARHDAVFVLGLLVHGKVPSLPARLARRRLVHCSIVTRRGPSAGLPYRRQAGTSPGRPIASRFERAERSTASAGPENRGGGESREIVSGNAGRGKEKGRTSCALRAGRSGFRRRGAVTLVGLTHRLPQSGQPRPGIVGAALLALGPALVA